VNIGEVAHLFDNWMLHYSPQCLAQKPFFLVDSLSETSRGGREPIEKCLLKNGRLIEPFMLLLVPNLDSLLLFFWRLEFPSRSLSTVICDGILLLTFDSSLPNSFTVHCSPWTHTGQGGSYFSVSAVKLSRQSAW
jgi:hypothetical protein